ncbi:MAG: hypothetical protein H6720_19315 [Sandaracinus sp.]|nr:hypothetical protein [Sandaracinus sp.]
MPWIHGQSIEEEDVTHVLRGAVSRREREQPVADERRGAQTERVDERFEDRRVSLGGRSRGG